MAALLYFAVKSLDDIIGANKPPMFLWELIEGQAGIQIAAQTIHDSRINPFIFGDKGGCLFSFFAVDLIEEFGTDLLLLLFGDAAQHVLHFVLDAPLPFGPGKLVLDSVEYGFAAVCNPQIDLLDATVFQVVQETFPSFLVLTISDGGIPIFGYHGNY